MYRCERWMLIGAGIGAALATLVATFLLEPPDYLAFMIVVANGASLGILPGAILAMSGKGYHEDHHQGDDLNVQGKDP